jgi:4-hydroxy-tetrahydrodipicolinate reductase
MMNVIINGICGRMGRMIAEALSEEQTAMLVAGFDKADTDAREALVFHGQTVPIFKEPPTNPSALSADVIIDFSNYTAVSGLLAWAAAAKIPTVICTTALGSAERDALRAAAHHIPVFNSSNMSLGINLIAKMCKMSMPMLETHFHAEIIEKHHSQKSDSPSGTALLLAEAINDGCATKKNLLYGRHGKADAPKLTELGIHAVRGGTLPGQHTVLFAGPDEVIEITHTVYSRRVFAQGAVLAAQFIIGKAPGLYSMDDLIDLECVESAME